MVGIGLCYIKSTCLLVERLKGSSAFSMGNLRISISKAHDLWSFRRSSNRWLIEIGRIITYINK